MAYLKLLSNMERKTLTKEEIINKMLSENPDLRAINTANYFKKTVKRGAKAPQAGGVVHSDFEQNFIKAEVIPWNLLLKAGSWQKAKERGWLKTAGKDYLVQDGDVIEFKV